MAFWEEAVDQAGRDFGHRFRRWFWTARTVKRAAPGLVFVGLVGLVAWGAMWVWDHLSEIGPAAGHAWDGVSIALLWLLLAAGVAGLAALIRFLIVRARQPWRRWYL
jgi:hypothetical protein